MFLMGFLSKGIAAVRERAAIPFVTTRSVQPKEWCMEFKEYDFIRNPVVQNEVFSCNRNVVRVVCGSRGAHLKN